MVATSVLQVQEISRPAEKTGNGEPGTPYASMFSISIVIPDLWYCLENLCMCDFSARINNKGDVQAKVQFHSLLCSNKFKYMHSVAVSKQSDGAMGKLKYSNLFNFTTAFNNDSNTSDWVKKNYLHE